MSNCFVECVEDCETLPDTDRSSVYMDAGDKPQALPIWRHLSAYYIMYCISMHLVQVRVDGVAQREQKTKQYKSGRIW